MWVLKIMLLKEYLRLWGELLLIFLFNKVGYKIVYGMIIF